MRLDRQKGPTKFEPFYSFFLIFSKMVLKTKQVSSSLHSVDQDTSYKPSNTLWTWTVLKKKSGKITIRVQFFWTFLMVKSYFFKNSPSKWVVVFCIAISASKRFIWAIKRHYPMIFHFHFSRWGLSATPRGWTGQKQFSKCLSWTLRHFPSAGNLISWESSWPWV